MEDPTEAVGHLESCVPEHSAQEQKAQPSGARGVPTETDAGRPAQSSNTQDGSHAQCVLRQAQESRNQEGVQETPKELDTEPQESKPPTGQGKNHSGH